jgi:hypothetical protein
MLSKFLLWSAWICLIMYSIVVMLSFLISYYKFPFYIYCGAVIFFAYELYKHYKVKKQKNKKCDHVFYIKNSIWDEDPVCIKCGKKSSYLVKNNEIELSKY